MTAPIPRSLVAVSRVTTAVSLVAIALLTATTCWILRSAVVPLADVTDDVSSAWPSELLMFSPPASHLLGWYVASLVVVVALHGLVNRERFARDGCRGLLDWRSLWYAPPLLLLVLPPAVIALQATPLRIQTAAWVYLFVDLRWWFLAAVAILVIGPTVSHAAPSWHRSIVRRLTAADRAPSPSSRLWLEVALVGGLLAASLLSSPQARFEARPIGDEPKYLRYLENWYRGRGMDIDGLDPIADLPAGSRSNVAGNFRKLGPALRTIAADMGADARRLIGWPAPPRGRATSDADWFVTGRHGGLYQVHSPGLSVLLFPGYYLDRSVLILTSDDESTLPSFLYCTGGTLILLYLLWGVVLFDLLWVCTGRLLVSWGLASVAMISLPASAFAYQYYPEAAAGLFITVLARYTLCRSLPGAWAGFALGLMAGFLPWIHVRFLLVAMTVGVFFVLTRGRPVRSVIWFLAGLALPLLAMAIYHYHITGSLLPTALYDVANSQPTFTPSRAPSGVQLLWLHRGSGLAPHAPIYLFAVAGLCLAWRRDRRVALGVATLVAALVIAAAGHEPTGAGTTPLRLVAAVMPLLMLPVAEVALRAGSSRWLLGTIVLLAVLSIQSGLTYGVHLDKLKTMAIEARSVSGWLPTLLFPPLDAPGPEVEPWRIAWLAATGLIAAWPLLASVLPHRAHGAGEQAWPWWLVTAGVVLGFATLGSGVAAATGDTIHPRYLVRPEAARDRLLAFEQRHGGGWRWSAARGSVSTVSLLPNLPESRAAVEVSPAARIGEPVEVTINASDPDGRRAWGDAQVQFGDGSPSVHVPVFGATRVRHRYEEPHSYTIDVDIELPPSGPVRHSARVQLVSEPSGVWRPDLVPPVDRVPPEVPAWPAGLEVAEVRASSSHIDVRLSPPHEWSGRNDVAGWLWFVSEERSMLYLGMIVDPTTVRFELRAGPPRPGSVVWIVLALKTRSDAVRTEFEAIEWPSPVLMLGAPVEVALLKRPPTPLRTSR